MNEIRVLHSILQHKRFILTVGKKLFVPIHVLWQHDLDKLTDWSLIRAYGRVIRFDGSKYYYPKPVSEQSLCEIEDLRRGRLRHYRRAKHHWQHWNWRSMPDVYVREMIADWIAARLAGGLKPEPAKYYLKFKSTMYLPIETKERIEFYLAEQEILWSPNYVNNWRV